MKQNPARLKYRKNHKYSKSFYILENEGGCYPLKGNYYVCSSESGYLTFKQIEACRKTLRRQTKGIGELWIRVFTFVSKTKKGIGTRMGKGKGVHSIWLCPIRKGQVLFEIAGLTELDSKGALERVRDRLPIKTEIKRIKY